MNYIERGYKLFENYKVSEIINACTYCCLSQNEIDRLVNLKLKNIDVELLSMYNDSAQSYEPRIEEFKHFLPRYIELVGQFKFPSHSVELSLKNISFYNLNQWSEEEWDFLNEFVTYFFKKCIKTFPIPNNWSGLSSILIMLNKAGFALSPFLKLWELDDSVNGCLHYKELLTSDFDWLRRTKIRNAFGDKNLSETIYNWSIKREVQQKYLNQIENIIMSDLEMEETDLNELNWLYDILKLNIP